MGLKVARAPEGSAACFWRGRIGFSSGGAD